MRYLATTTHLLCDDQTAVVDAYQSLSGSWGLRPPRLGSQHPVEFRAAFSPSHEGWVSVVEDAPRAFPERSAGFPERPGSTLRSRSGNRVRELTRQLSAHLECPALSLVLVAPDVLYYFYYVSGTLVDRYCSWPLWYQDARPTAAQRRLWRGNPRALLPLCRPGVPLARLRQVVRDLSLLPVDAGVPASTVALELGDLLGIAHPLIDPSLLSVASTPLRIALPATVDEAHTPVQAGNFISLQRQDVTPLWKGSQLTSSSGPWEHLSLVRCEPEPSVRWA